MPVAKGRRHERISEEEVRQRWSSISIDQRQEAMFFEDSVLLDRIRSGLQVLFEKQTIMQHLGISCPGGVDPLESSMLLKEAFQFTWNMARSSQNTGVIISADPALVMKLDFIQRLDFIERIREVLPDFLQRSSRTPMPRARWKELCAIEPSSVAVLEQQLARLVEQALWAMAAQPAAKASIPQGPKAMQANLEPWMEKYDKKVAQVRETAKKKSKNNKGSSIKPLEPTVEEEVAPSEGAEEDEYDQMEEVHKEDQQELDEKAFKEVTLKPGPTLEVRTRSTLDDDTGATLADAWGDDAEETFDNPSEGHSDDRCLLVNGKYLSPLPLPGKTDEEHEYVVETPSPRLSSMPSGAFKDGGSMYIPAQTPPPSPAGDQGQWQPQQLVCYIWGQTSQFGVHGLGPGVCCGTPLTGSTQTPSTLSTSSHESPWRRGHWMTTQPQTPVAGTMLRAGVRNTFIDVNICSDDPAPAVHRRTRSLSPTPRGAPSLNSRDEDNDEWLWYWH